MVESITRLPPLNALRAFTVAARHRSLTRAGEELHVTPAAVGHQVRALEDYLGAGAVLSALSEASRSPEARVCEAAFRELRNELPEILRECGSGRELEKMGFEQDVAFAAELDRFDVVPVLKNGWLVAQERGEHD